MTIKVIVELPAKPGRRTELKSLLEGIVEKHGKSARGFLGGTRYEVVDNPDLLIEIAEWDSVEARAAHMKEAMAAGIYTPLLELLSGPFRATVIKELP